jgi:dipeptidyl aminopeptidase/acylaminoacyl peptidase
MNKRTLLTGVLVLALSSAGVSMADTASRAGGRNSATNARTGTARAGQIVFRRYLDPAESTGAIFVTTANGSNEHQITTPPPATLDGEPDWAPDGKHLLFTRFTNNLSDHESHQLFLVASDGTGLTPLSPDLPAQGDVIPGFDGTGAFSPDGMLIAFSYAHGKVGSDQIQFSDIWVMTADGSNRRQVTHLPAYAGDAGGVAWSPNGKHLVYSLTNTKRRALFTVNVDGTHGHRLTPWSLGANGTPDWAPTNRIVFRAVVDEESGIGNFFSIRADGTGLHQITHFINSVISHKVGYSPDGKRVVFAKAAGSGKNHLFTVKLNGSDLRRLTNTPAADSGADWATAP